MADFDSTTRFCDLFEPMTLQSGATLESVRLAYELYGDINEARDNVILVFHALTGTQHAAGYNPSVPEAGGLWTEDVTEGWWSGFIGPDKALDTERFAVLCVNYLGGCYGSTGPGSIDPATGTPYGSRFPKLSLTDVVDSQMRLADQLGISRLHAVIGGSVGGMMCAVVATRYPDRVGLVIPIGAGLEVTSLQVLHNFEQMFSIVTDPAFEGGDYYSGSGPELGLALARMIGHKTFVSLDALRERARNQIIAPEDLGGFQVGHVLESYMLHEAKKFTRRFDANTYVRIMELWQQFDLAGEVGAPVDELLSGCRDQRWMVFTIDSDVCFYPEEQEQMVARLMAAGVPVRRFTVHSNKGHDSFLIEPHLYSALLRSALHGHW